jgi:hypothetical protein
MSVDVITQAAFASGRIIHQGTGEELAGQIEITAQEGPIISKVLDDGTFVLSGYLRFLFPDLSTQNYTLNLTISANSQQYRQGLVEQSVVLNIPLGSNFDPDVAAPVDPPINMGTIVLPADPITIRGRVVEAEDLDQAIPNATVEILHAGPPIAPVLTNTEGRYSFDNITVTAPSQIRCSEPSFLTITRTLLLDFGYLVNEENFRLPPP